MVKPAFCVNCAAVLHFNTNKVSTKIHSVVLLILQRREYDFGICLKFMFSTRKQTKKLGKLSSHNIYSVPPQSMMMYVCILLNVRRPAVNNFFSLLLLLVISRNGGVTTKTPTIWRRKKERKITKSNFCSRQQQDTSCDRGKSSTIRFQWRAFLCIDFSNCCTGPGLNWHSGWFVFEKRLWLTVSDISTTNLDHSDRNTSMDMFVFLQISPLPFREVMKRMHHFWPVIIFCIEKCRHVISLYNCKFYMHWSVWIVLRPSGVCVCSSDRQWFDMY